LAWAVTQEGFWEVDKERRLIEEAEALARKHFPNPLADAAIPVVVAGILYGPEQIGLGHLRALIWRCPPGVQVERTRDKLIITVPREVLPYMSNQDLRALLEPTINEARAQRPPARLKRLPRKKETELIADLVKEHTERGLAPSEIRRKLDMAGMGRDESYVRRIRRKMGLPAFKSRTGRRGR
jgi:hypothetical protein